MFINQMIPNRYFECMPNIFLCPCYLKSTFEDAPVYHVGYLSSNGFLRVYWLHTVWLSAVWPQNQQKSLNNYRCTKFEAYQAEFASYWAGNFVLYPFFFYLSIFFTFCFNTKYTIVEYSRKLTLNTALHLNKNSKTLSFETNWKWSLFSKTPNDWCCYCRNSIDVCI
jgi:hypothetical protein